MEVVQPWRIEFDLNTLGLVYRHLQGRNPVHIHVVITFYRHDYQGVVFAVAASAEVKWVYDSYIILVD